MFSYEAEHIHICYQCVGEEYLKEQIRLEGKRGKCKYCRGNRKSIPLPWLAEKIHEVLDKYFINTSSEYCGHYGTPPGEPVIDVVQSIADVDSVVADDVLNYLSYNFGPSPKDFEIDPYGDDAWYSEAPPDSWNQQQSWGVFCGEVTQKARFFSPVAEKILDELFSNIISFKRYDGKSVVREVGPGTENDEIYRARVAQTQEELDQILSRPNKELAAPPAKYAKNGRMNASGISVFYGAASAETCVAEVRPPVGSQVVVGRFQILRKLYLLDFDVLSQVYAKVSVFDPAYGPQIGHAAFLRKLVAELTRPVLPSEEGFKYLPTQIVAEYLAEKVKPKLDGIVFRSTQDNEKGENIVLFQGRSNVEPHVLPNGTKIFVDHGWIGRGDHDDSITVRETVPTETTDRSGPGSLEQFELPLDAESYPDDFGEIVLRLDINKDVKVWVISGVKFDFRERYTSRHRVKQS